MPLVIRAEGPIYAPVIVCDNCGERIEDAKEGNYEWQPDQSKADFPVAFVHKACCRAFEAANGGGFYWAPLTCLPLFLGHNLKVDRKEAESVATIIAA